MEFSIEQDSGSPLYLQIMDQIRYAISLGELRPGDALPSIREFEVELGVNRNTIRRAYLELEREGTLVICQGKETRVAPKAASRQRKISVSKAGELASKMVREAESKGLDSIQFASVFRQFAMDHDARHPKCVFIECSRDQAMDFAKAAEKAWNRRVIGVDLQRLRRDAELSPSTVHVLTTSWHLSEVKELLTNRVESIQEVNVQPTKAFHEGIVRLKGLKCGLLLRDRESIAGYRRLVGKHITVKGNVRGVLVGEREKALELMNRVEGLVYTTPCRKFVKEHAPSHLITQELLYEPVPDDLTRLAKELFAPLVRSSAV